jgi:sugar/nucleoside kinase (ribokinase family)
MLDVFILPTGRAFFDLIFAKAPHWIRPGEELTVPEFTMCAGGSYNIALAMHRLGLDIGYCTHLGDDLFSCFIRDAINKEKMNTDFLIEHKDSKIAVTASLSRSDDRAFISYVEPLPEFDPADLPEHGTPNVIFVPGIPDKPELLFDYLDQKKEAGSMIVCDCAHIEKDLDDESISTFISKLDLFICNAKEAKTLTHKPTQERGAMVLGKLCPEIVIKLGSQGALALDGGLVLRERAIPIKFEDSTGAGDGFNAGYVYGLVEGMLVERRLRLGNVVGGCFAAGLGSSNAPTIDEVLTLEQKHYAHISPTD